jgi:hypothetical protein
MKSPPPPSLLGMDVSNTAPLLVSALKRDPWVGAAFYRKVLWPKLPLSAQQHLPKPSAGNATVRGNAGFYFFHLKTTGPATNLVIRELTRALNDDDVSAVRINAARALGEIGTGNRTASAALVRALRDQDRSVRQSATNALLKLDSEAAARQGISVAALVLLLTEHQDLRVRNDAASVLMSLNNGDERIAAAWIKALHDTNRGIRMQATNALQQLDPELAAKAGVKPPPP